MKKIALIFLTLLPLIKVTAQTPKTDAALNTQGNTIKNETNPNANTPIRVGTWMLDENASKVNNNQYSGVTVTGTDTYAACPTTAIVSYPAFYSIKVTFTNANTGPATLSLCGLAAKNIKKILSGALVSLTSGDICIGCSYWLMYNGTDFQILGGGSSGGGGGSGVWGAITGTLTDQTDLKAAMDLKQPYLKPTSVKTATYNAVDKDFVPVDATGATVQINLPTSPAESTVIGVKMIATGSSNLTQVTVGGSDKFNVAGGATTFSLTAKDQTAYFQFHCTTSFLGVCSNGLWYSTSQNTLTNSAVINEVPKIDGTLNLVTSGLYSSTAGNLDLGSTSLTGDRTISAKSSSASNSLYLQTTNGSSAATNALQLFISGTKTVIVAPPGNLSLSGSFYGGRSLIGSASGFDFTNYPAGLSEVVATNNSSPNTVLLPFRIAATASSGTPANGFGVGMEFAAQNASSTNIVGSTISSVADDIVAGTEDFSLRFKTITAGTLAEKIRFTSLGEIGLSGANYGTAGQTIVSGGPGAAVTWGAGGGSGTVSTVSVVTANGLAGTVANPTTTPAITLSTTLNGLVKGNGTAFSAASAGTDYQAPITFGTGIQTALGVNVGSAGAPILFNGAGGTPTSLTLTNATGLSLTAGVTGILPVANGGYYGAIEVATLFSEPWTNTSNWTSVGAPSASVAGGQLTLAGTPSSSTNYIRCSGYGNTAVEFGYWSWTETVGTIGASTSGVGFGLQNQSGFSAGSLMVNLELSTTSTGVIKWFLNNSASASQTSTVALSSVVQGSVLNCKLWVLPDGFRFEVAINGSTTPISDKFLYVTNIGWSVLTPNAAQFAYYNLGQGATPHTVGALTYYCKQLQNSDLWIGDSITHGEGVQYLFNRWISVITRDYNANAESLSRQGNQITDTNVTEVGLFNPNRIVIFVGTNDLQNVSVATTRTRLASLVTSLGSLVTSNAPSGYTVANGKLKFMTALPRFNTSAFNANMVTDYGVANIIDAYSPLYTGTASLNLPKWSFDSTHPNDEACQIIADVVASFMGYTRNRFYGAGDIKLTFNKANAITGGWTGILGNSHFSFSLPAAGTPVLGYGAFWTPGGFIPTTASNILTGMAVAGRYSVYIQSGTVGTAISTIERSYMTSSIAGSSLKHYFGDVSTTPTAWVHLTAGTATANTAPIKFTSGVSLTSPEAGAAEFTTDDLFFTITTGATRKRILMADPSGGLTSGRVSFATTNGRVTDDAGLTYASSNLTVGAANNIVGTATNNSATAGNIGEEINAIQSTYTNYTTTATYQNITSITLTAGDWDISAMVTYNSNSATITAAANAIYTISTTTASAAGAVEGQSIGYIPQAALLGTSKFTDVLAPYRVSLSGTTTYYLNTQAAFSVGNPQFVGSIRARRIR